MPPAPSMAPRMQTVLPPLLPPPIPLMDQPVIPSLMSIPQAPPHLSLLSPSHVHRQSLDSEMQQKVLQQQLLLEQQKTSQKQDDLLRLQHQALIEKTKEENEKQALLLRLQQEAFKQNEDEQKQLQALGLKPPPSSAGMIVLPPCIAVDKADTGIADISGCTSGVSGVGAILAELQQQRQLLPPPVPSAVVMPTAATLMGTAPPMLLTRPQLAQLRPVGPPPPRPMGLMGHSPIRPPVARPESGMTPMRQQQTAPPRPPPRLQVSAAGLLSCF